MPLRPAIRHRNVFLPFRVMDRLRQGVISSISLCYQARLNGALQFKSQLETMHANTEFRQIDRQPEPASRPLVPWPTRRPAPPRSGRFLGRLGVLAALLVLHTASAQTLKLNFNFSDAPGVTTTDSVVLAACNMTNYNKVLTDLHGTNGSGPGKLGRTLDLTTNTTANAANSVTSGTSTASVSDYGDARINLGTVNSFTVAFWFRSATTLGSGFSPQLFVLAPGGNARSTLLQGGANTLGFNINTSGNPQFWVGGTTVPNPVASSTLAANAWYLYALTYDGSRYQVYVGNETSAVTCVNTNTTAGATLAFGTSGTIVFGDRASDNTRNFPGWLARFQFYTGGASQSFVDSVRQASLPLAVGTTTYSPISPVSAGTLVTVGAPVVNGILPYAYNWQISTDGGATFATLPTGNGAATYSYNTTGLPNTTNYFRVIVTDSSSLPVAITNTPAPLVITGPLPPLLGADTTVTPSLVTLGGSATLSAAFAGTTPIYYQWQYAANTNGAGLANLTVLSTNNPGLTISNAQFAHSGVYRLVASNTVAGGSVSNSTWASLTVLAPVLMADFGAVAPTPGTHDVSQLNTAGGSTTPAGFASYLDTDAPESGQTFTTGANPGGYSLRALYYQMYANGHAASRTYRAHLYSVSGDTATLIGAYTNANVSPTLPSSDWIQLTGLTNVLSPNATYAYTILFSGAGGQTLANASGVSVTGDPSSDQSGNRLCKIPYGGGAVTNGTVPGYNATFMAHLTLAGAPEIYSLTMSPTNGSTVFAGQPVTLNVSALGSLLTYYWQLDGGTGFTNLPAANTSTYALNTATLAPGTYSLQVLVSNSVDVATSTTLTLTVAASQITTVSLAPTNSATGTPGPVHAGTPVTLSATASGFNLTYYWQTDGGLGGGFSDIPNATTNAFTLDTSAMSPGTYYYQLVVSNSLGTITSSLLTLYLAAAQGPVLVTDTRFTPSAVAMAGNPVSVAASFSGSLPMNFQWYFTTNGGGTRALAGATNASYTLTSAQWTDAGSYFVSVTNNPPGLGPQTAASTPTVLYVVPPSESNSVSAGVIDAGAGTPFVGTHDIAQLNYQGGNTLSINYYVDNSLPPGQTFTTGNTPPSPAGYPLRTLYLKQDNSGTTSGFATATTYTLRIYQLLDGTNAALLTSYVTTNTLAFGAGDWIYFYGLTNLLQTNATYAFSLQRPSGWWKVAASPNNDYLGG
jgi:hypothetical protein